MPMRSQFDVCVSFFDSNIFTWRNFLWAYEIFWSRALTVSAPWWKDRPSLQYLQAYHQADEDDIAEEVSNIPKDHMAALVPIVDMLNHSLTSKISYFTDVKSNRFALRSVSGVPNGVQAFNNYGLRNNEKLLLNYGFVLENNVVDSFHLKVAMSANDPYFQRRTNILKKKRIQASHYLVKGEQTVPADLMEDLRIRLMNEVELYFYEQSEILGQSSKTGLQYTSQPIGEIISFRNESRMLYQLLAMLTARAKRFPTTIEDDRQILAVPNIDHIQRSAVLYRLGQKELIQSAIQYVTRLQQEFYQHIARITPQSLSGLTPATLKSQSLIDYDNWIRQICSFGNISFTSLIDSQEGAIVATANIAANEKILSIPRDFILTADAAINGCLKTRLRDYDVEELRELLRSQMEEDTILALAIMEESKSLSSRWEKFFNVARSSLLSSPLFYSEDQLGELEGTNIPEMVAQLHEQYLQECESLFAVLQEVGVFTEAVHTWKSFLFAKALIDSRGIEIDIEGEANLAILPIAFPAVHNPYSIPNLEYSVESNNIVIKAKLACNSGGFITDDRDRGLGGD